MRRRISHSPQTDEDLNIWQAFTDLMSSTFLIMSLFLFLVLIKSKFSQKFPPVTVIKDSDTLQFETGRADLPKGLSQYIQDKIVPDLEKTAKEYPQYQLIEVIGHTDGQATIAQSNPSNLDTSLEAVAKGNNPVNTLQAGSNTDLGLIRALAVVKKLQELQQSGRLKGLKFRAYSAGQLLLPDGSYADGSDRASNPSRRRIEIRFSPNPEPRSLRCSPG